MIDGETAKLIFYILWGAAVVSLIAALIADTISYHRTRRNNNQKEQR